MQRSSGRILSQGVWIVDTDLQTDAAGHYRAAVMILARCLSRLSGCVQAAAHRLSWRERRAHLLDIAVTVYSGDSLSEGVLRRRYPLSLRDDAYISRLVSYWRQQER